MHLKRPSVGYPKQHLFPCKIRREKRSEARKSHPHALPRIKENTTEVNKFATARGNAAVIIIQNRAGRTGRARTHHVTTPMPHHPPHTNSLSKSPGAQLALAIAIASPAPSRRRKSCCRHSSARTVSPTRPHPTAEAVATGAGLHRAAAAPLPPESPLATQPAAAAAKGVPPYRTPPSCRPPRATGRS
ncbi:unnamed protein product [Ectocarpus sp. 12 AP-2014]